MGGLGNQMFQYAFGRCLAKRNDTILKLDLSFFSSQDINNKNHVFRNYDLDIFNVQENFASVEEVTRLSKRSKNIFLDKALNKLSGKKKSFILEPHFHFSSKVYNTSGDIYLHGYWQSEKYFSEVKSLIMSDFTFKEEMTCAAKNLQIKIKNSNSICVNVRRGDFITNSNLGFKGVDYFKQAESIINAEVSDPNYYIFSDEIEWCEENLKFNAPTFFVSHYYAGKKFQDYLRLMASCKHYIMPNSSFAWWAVWFNQDTDKIVIAPKTWFNDQALDTKDLVPAGWIRI